MSTDEEVWIYVFGAYAQVTGNYSENKAGYELMRFNKVTRKGLDGKDHVVWISSHDPGYILYGIGRVKQPETNAPDSETNVDDIKQAAQEGRK